MIVKITPGFQEKKCCELVFWPVKTQRSPQSNVAVVASYWSLAGIENQVISDGSKCLRNLETNLLDGEKLWHLMYTQSNSGLGQTMFLL